MTMHPSRRSKSKDKAAPGSFLGGQLLIAMPTIRDPHFARAVVYMCTHSSEGAMGLIINRFAADGAGHYPPQAHSAALFFTATGTLLAFLWYLPMVQQNKKL